MNVRLTSSELALDVYSYTDYPLYTLYQSDRLGFVEERGTAANAVFSVAFLGISLLAYTAHPMDTIAVPTEEPRTCVAEVFSSIDPVPDMKQVGDLSRVTARV